MDYSEKKSDETEDRFRRIVESSPMAMHFYRLDPDRRLILTGANPAAVKVVGISHEELLNREIGEIFPKLKGTPVPELYRQVAAGELGPQSFEIEYRDLPITGYFDVHVFSTGGGTIAVNFQDITERKQLEENLARKATEWSRTFDSVEDMIAIVDSDYHLVRVNLAMAKAVGRTPEECVGMHCHEVVHGCSVPHGSCPHQQTLAGHGPASMDFYEPNMGKYLHVTTTPLMYSDGTIQGSVHVLRDITRRSVAEQVLRDTEEIFRFFMEFSPVYVFFKDENLRTIRLSRNYEQMLGKPLDQLLGKSVTELFPADLAERMMADDRLVLEKGTPLLIVEEFNGRVYSSIKFPIYLEGGAKYLAGFTMDITENKRAENALLEKNIELEAEVAERQQAQRELSVKHRQLDELNHHLAHRISSAVAEIRAKDELLILQSRQSAMGEMIGNIAHQWRQPLNNIGLIIQLLQRLCNSGEINREEINRQFDIVMSIIMYMSRTVDEFRNYFAPDKAKESFSLSRVITQSLELISAAFDTIGIKVVLELCAMDMVRGYPNEFVQVMLVILGNARDQLVEQSITEPRIDIRSYHRDGRIVVAIRDNGGGIQEGVLPKIFDPYFTTKEQGKGTGIGLYMSKMIIEKHMNGMLSATNRDGGAEFRIELPLEG